MGGIDAEVIYASAAFVTAMAGAWVKLNSIHRLVNSQLDKVMARLDAMTVDRDATVVERDEARTERDAERGAHRTKQEGDSS